jgi:hypothetical protein
LNESLRKALALANAHSLASSLICGNGMDWRFLALENPEVPSRHD